MISEQDVVELFIQSHGGLCPGDLAGLITCNEADKLVVQLWLGMRKSVKSLRLFICENICFNIRNKIIGNRNAKWVFAMEFFCKYVVFDCVPKYQTCRLLKSFQNYFIVCLCKCVLLSAVCSRSHVKQLGNRTTISLM